MTTITGVAIRIMGDATSFVAAAARAEAAATSMGGKIAAVAGVAVGSLMALAGVVGLVFTGASLAAAVKYEYAFADVAKTLNAGKVELADMSKQIRQLATEIPASAVEIARVASTAAQLGIAKENVVAFTHTMIDLGNATNLTADDAATAIAHIMNATGMAASEVDQFAAVLVQMGNNGASSEAEILQMANRMAAAAHLVGMTTPELLGWANALSSIGIEAEMGGTAFARSMRKMDQAVNSKSKGAQERLAAFAGISGMGITEFQTSFKSDASGTFMKFVQGLDAIHKSGGSVDDALQLVELDGLRVAETLLKVKVAGDMANQMIYMANDQWRAHDALMKEVARRYETTAMKAEVFKNKVVDSMIEFGNAMKPLLDGAMAGLSAWFDEHGDEFREFFRDIKPLLASIGSGLQVVGGVLYTIIAAVVNAAKVIGGWINKFPALWAVIAAGAGIAIIALGLMGGPITAFVAVLVGAVAIFLGFVALVGMLRDNWRKVWNVGVDVVNKLYEIPVVGGLIHFGIGLIVTQVESWIDTVKRVRDHFQEVLDIIVGINREKNKTPDEKPSGKLPATGGITPVGGGLDFYESAGKLKDMWNELPDGLRNAMTRMIHAVTSTLEQGMVIWGVMIEDFIGKLNKIPGVAGLKAGLDKIMQNGNVGKVEEKAPFKQAPGHIADDEMQVIAEAAQAKADLQVALDKEWARRKAEADALDIENFAKAQAAAQKAKQLAEAFQTRMYEEQIRALVTSGDRMLIVTKAHQAKMAADWTKISAEIAQKTGANAEEFRQMWEEIENAKRGRRGGMVLDAFLENGMAGANQMEADLAKADARLATIKADPAVQALQEKWGFFDDTILSALDNMIGKAKEAKNDIGDLMSFLLLRRTGLGQPSGVTVPLGGDLSAREQAERFAARTAAPLQMPVPSAAGGGSGRTTTDHQLNQAGAGQPGIVIENLWVAADPRIPGGFDVNAAVEISTKPLTGDQGGVR